MRNSAAAVWLTQDGQLAEVRALFGIALPLQAIPSARATRWNDSGSVRDTRNRARELCSMWRDIECVLMCFHYSCKDKTSALCLCMAVRLFPSDGTTRPHATLTPGRLTCRSLVSAVILALC